MADINSFQDRLIDVVGGVAGSAINSAAGSQIDKLKADAEELKQMTKAYLAAQMTLQFIATCAIVGTFLLAVSNHKKGR